jgi:predicted amidohydrolase YtcJ
MDSHIHFQSTAAGLGEVILTPDTTPNMDVFLEKVKERIQKLPEESWIYGHGWDQNKIDWFGSGTESINSRPVCTWIRLLLIIWFIY